MNPILTIAEREQILKLARAAKLERSWSRLSPIEPVDRGGRLPLSFAQQRLWFLERLGGMGNAYHIPWRLRLRGQLDVGGLRRALERIVARHEVLRTTFALADGEPVQRIAPVEESRFLLAERDLSGEPEEEVRRLVAEEAGRPFDLERGPLVRGLLVRLGEDDHVLQLTMHHIVSDGWSMGVLTGELSALYAAFHRGEPDPLPPLAVQYADYAAWQRRGAEGEVLREQAEYWKRRLAGAPELLELPADQPRPAVQDHAGASLEVALDEELTKGLKALGQRQGTTLFMTLLAGWAVVLSRLSGQDEVVVGTPTANRDRGEVEGLIGFFVNTLALRLDLSGAPTVAELLGQVKERALEAQRHQDIPFEQVVELARPVRSLAYSPLFQVMFAWQNAPEGDLRLPGVQVAPMGPGTEEASAKFDLSLSLGESGGRIVGELQYATSLYGRATVERYLGYLRRVLEAMAAEPRRRVGELEMLPEAERALVVEEWNATEASYPRSACVHDLFEAWAKRSPDAAAVAFEGAALSYGELSRRANRLAHHLRALGVGPDVLVGICVERSMEMVVALFAVLKAGGAFVPLDPEYPEERLRYMVEDSAPAVMLTQGPLLDRFGGLAIPALDLVGDAAAWAHRPEGDPDPATGPEHLAYVIYTSGSTGRPKGVANVHRNLVNRLAWMQDAWRLDPSDTVLQKTTLSFDAFAREIFWPLASGARVLVMAPEGHRDPAALVEVIRRERVGVVSMVPSLLQVFLDHPGAAGCTGLRRVLCGGEALPRSLAGRFQERLPGLPLHNLYGPSEAATATAARIGKWEGEEGRVPIGGPIANTRIYLLDAGGEPVPVGVAGELYIGGAGVARGYLGRPEMTAERFVPDPFGKVAGGRLYRTGDLGRWLAGGVIEYLGRNDAQVKVRGYRIELGEVEARLAEHPAVREAAVVAREEVAGDTRLVAYWVGAETLEAEALRAHLSARLPEYMVPAAYVRLEALPLTPNGKVDRAALPAPEGDAYARRGYEAPLGEVEATLAGIWAEVLRVERVGRWDHFFELGGHSLLAVRVGSRVRERLGVEVSLGEVFRLPTLAEYARGVAAAARANLPPIERVDRTQPLPLSFAQQRLWFLEQLGEVGNAYHLPWRLRLRGELDAGALRRALERIVARHEVLRTTFSLVQGEPVQRIAPVEESPFLLAEHDLAGDADAEEALIRLLAREWDTPFDLERGPLIRGLLVRLGEDEHVLQLTMHHIVSDGWSMGVLSGELGALYAAFRRGEGDPLPEPAVQYADYAAWQRRWVEGEVLRAQAEYWKRRLAGGPELLELPTGHPRPAVRDHAGALLEVTLDEALTRGLNELSRREGTTLFMTLLAGWAVVLSRLSGQEEVVIGTPTANRGQGEIEGLIGFFLNTLALRLDLSGAPTVGELLGRVRERALEAQHHQDIPFEQVVETVQPARSLAHAPLFQVMFAWQTAQGGGLALPGVEVAEMGGGAEQASASSSCRWGWGSRTGGSRDGCSTPPRCTGARRWSATSATCAGCWRPWRPTRGGASPSWRCSPRRSGGGWWRSGTRRRRSIRGTPACTSSSSARPGAPPTRWRWPTAPTG